MPQCFFTHGRPVIGDGHAYASRTLCILASLVAVFECSGRPAVVAGADPGAGHRLVRFDAGVRMRGRWR